LAYTICMRGSLLQGAVCKNNTRVNLAIKAVLC
jgi:hypothetical protein